MPQNDWKLIYISPGDYFEPPFENDTGYLLTIDYKKVISMHTVADQIMYKDDILPLYFECCDVETEDLAVSKVELIIDEFKRKLEDTIPYNKAYQKYMLLTYNDPLMLTMLDPRSQKWCAWTEIGLVVHVKD